MLRSLANNPVAIQYIKDCLEQGNSLARQLLDLPLKSGEVFATISDDIDEARYNQYTVGGITSARATDSFLTAFIAAYLHSATNRYVVFEDVLSRPGDPLLSSHNQSFVSFGNEILYFVASQNNDAQIIGATIRFARSHVFVGVLTSPHLEVTLQHEQTVTEETLRVIVEGTEAIIIGAYDGEGVLIWKLQP